MADKVIKILLVDDIPETRENLRKLLAFEPDMQVVGAASTGREGLELAAETRPDVILMDINMPDMDGISATKEIGRIVPTAAVVMMSVQTEAQYLREAMLAGARDFLNKPISGDDLYNTIRRVYSLNAVLRDQYAQMASSVPSSSAAGGPAGRKSPGRGPEGHVIAVYSPQGGAGTTTVATNTAMALMKEGTRVLLIDVDLQFGDVGVFLNLQAKNTIVDLAGSVKDLDEQLVESVMVAHASGLKVLLAPHTPEEADNVNPGNLVELIQTLRRYYDYIIIDMPTRLDDMTLGIMDAADRIMLIAIPTLPAIKNVRIILDLFTALKYPDEKVLFVMNRVSYEKAGRAFIPIEAIEQNLKRKTDGRILLDEKTFLSAVNQGVSVIAKDTNKSPAKDLIDLAEATKRSLHPMEEEEETAHVEPQRPASRLSGLFGGRK